MDELHDPIIVAGAVYTSIDYDEPLKKRVGSIVSVKRVTMTNLFK